VTLPSKKVCIGIVPLFLCACQFDAPVRSSIYLAQAPQSDEELCESADEQVDFDRIAAHSNTNVFFSPPKGLVCVFDDSSNLQIALKESPRMVATHALSSQRVGVIFKDSVITLRRLRHKQGR